MILLSNCESVFILKILKPYYLKINFFLDALISFSSSRLLDICKTVIKNKRKFENQEVEMIEKTRVKTQN